MEKINILLLSSYFPPDNHVGSWRWERLAAHFPEDRFNLFVVTGDNGLDYSQFHDDSGSVIVKRVSNIFRLSFRARYKERNMRKGVNQLGPSVRNPSSKFYARLARVRRWISLVLDFPDFSFRGSALLVSASEDIIKSRKIDLIIASHPYLVTLRSASTLSGRHGIPWIADMRDGITSNLFSPYLDAPFLNYLLGLVEKHVLRSAKHVVVINDQLAKTIKCQDRKKVIISNAFVDVKTACDARTKGDKLVLVYTGGVKPSHRFRPFLEGLKIYNDTASKQLVFNYYGRDFNMLLGYARHIGLDESILHDHGFVSSSVAQEQALNSDMVVMFGWNGPYGETYQSGKIFDYLATSRPILTVDESDSCLGSQVLNCRVGLVTCSPKGIAEILVKCALSSNFLDDVTADVNHEQIDRYSINTTGQKYIELIESVLF